MNQFVLWAFAGIGMLTSVLMVIALIAECINRFHEKRYDKFVSRYTAQRAARQVLKKYV